MPCMDPVDREIKFSTAKSSYDMRHLVIGREKPGIRSKLWQGFQQMSIAYSVVTKGGTQVSQLVAVRFKIGGGFNARHDVTN